MPSESVPMISLMSESYSPNYSVQISLFEILGSNAPHLEKILRITTPVDRGNDDMPDAIA